ncbi:MAG: CHAT domain-containing protein [Nostoc sp.]|uniref:CHAT domain-containing protein n=1 Tax=Nostoc sp. TaxID=1180 RepID=UPI002FF9A833
MCIHRYLILGILIFFLITTVLPATAQDSISRIQSQVILLEQGKQLYDAGKLAQAAQVWSQAAQIFQQRKQQHYQALSYNYLAIVYQDLGKWSAARSLITQAKNILKTIDDSFLYAQVLNTQGSLQLNTGQPEIALETWQQAEKIYRSLKDVTGIVLTQINQAQALQTLGEYRRAQRQLEQINQDLAVLPDNLLKARGLRSLGVTLQVVGDLERSQQVLSQSLAIAKLVNSTADIGETFLRLGNTARAREDFKAALEFYQQASSSGGERTQLEALLNQLSLLIKTEQNPDALVLLPQIQERLANLPPSRWGIYAQVNLAASWMKLSSSKTKDIAQLLATAVKQASELTDARAQSYALGELGHLYEQTQQFSEALNLTQTALSLAQGVQADDIAVNWLWQQGRIEKAKGNIETAITAYEQAVDSLTSLRQDLIQTSPNVQFSFRDRVEPVYRQLVQLLLEDVDSLPQIIKQQHLEKSRKTIEALQLAELENFFHQACLTYKPQPIDKIDPKAAVIYPILLERRLEVVVSLAGQPLQHYGTNLSLQEESKVFDELRQSLNLAFLPDEVLPSAQKLYDWLLRPAEKEIELQKIKTLVFVLDGFLRSVPMAVLHDRQQFIIQKYSIALTPGLQLLESRHLANQQFQALTAGLAEARQGFAELPGVKQEIKQITNYVHAKILLNEKFTRANVQKQIEEVPFSIVHLATHGEFSSKAEDTFLLTWEDRINVKDLDRWLKGASSKLSKNAPRQPIELLVLSACQTAKGDNHAALGLAGTAVRSGARSTLATLWSVQDKSTADLIAEFYRLLAQKVVSKAEALRQAQLSLLNSPQYKHPYYWSPFVLVGNWR